VEIVYWQGLDGLYDHLAILEYYGERGDPRHLPRFLGLINVDHLNLKSVWFGLIQKRCGGIGEIEFLRFLLDFVYYDRLDGEALAAFVAAEMLRLRRLSVVFVFGVDDSAQRIPDHLGRLARKLPRHEYLAWDVLFPAVGAFDDRA
jgi:hypothetical protein